MRPPAEAGARHQQMVRRVFPLLESGLIPGAVFAQLRSMSADDVPDQELHGVTNWAANKLALAKLDQAEPAITAESANGGQQVLP